MTWITQKQQHQQVNQLIKFSKKITNHFYNKELGTDDDYVIYIDTDSIFRIYSSIS